MEYADGVSFLFPIFATYMCSQFREPYTQFDMEIANNTIASLVYELRYDNKEGDIIESIDNSDPMEVLIGHQVLLDAFESKIKGLVAGDTFDFTLSPDEAYGAYDDEKLVTVPKAELLEGIPEEGAEEIFEGNIIPIVDDDDEHYEALIINVENDIVSLDFNHPLAGEALYFSGKIVNVRKASAKDIEKAEEF